MALSISDVDRMIKEVKTAEDLRLFGKVFNAANWASLTPDEKAKELIRLEHEDKERLILEQKMKEVDETSKRSAKAKKDAKALAIKQEAENKKKMKYYSPDGTITQNGVVIGKLDIDSEPKVVEVSKVVVTEKFLNELNNSLEKSLNKITNLKSDVAELTNTIYEKDKQAEENAEYHNRIYVSLKEDKKRLNKLGKKVQDERNAALTEVDVLKVQIKALEKQIKSLTKALETANNQPKQSVIAPIQQIAVSNKLVNICDEILKEQQERLIGCVQETLLDDTKIKKIRLGKDIENRQFVIRRGHKQSDGKILVTDFMIQKSGVVKLFDIAVTSWVSGDFEGVSGINHFGWISLNNEETIYPLTFSIIDQETGKIFEATSLTLSWMDTLETDNCARFGYYFINGKGLFSFDIVAGGTRLTNVGQAKSGTGEYDGKISTGKRVRVMNIAFKAFDEHYNKSLYRSVPKLKPEESL